MILEDNLKEGDCWEFSGSTGQIGIRLSSPIWVTHCAVDSPAPSKLSSRNFARNPLNMTLWGLFDHVPDSIPQKTFSTHGHQARKSGVALVDIEYRPSEGKTHHTFRSRRVHKAVEEVVIEIQGNHGGSTTCIYWIAVYGNQHHTAA